MIVNPYKFQAIIVKRNNKMKDSYPVNINQEVINSENRVKLFGVEIDNKLSFEKVYFRTRQKRKPVKYH